MSKTRLEEIRDIRLEKVKKLREMGIDPYPPHSEKEYSNLEVVENYDEFENKSVTLAGRLMSWREHGQIIFGQLQDVTGSIQIFIKSEELKDTDTKEGILGFDDLNLIDIGDFLQVRGEIAKTSRGEVSIIPDSIKILSKSIRPLPEKWEGLKDTEIIYRKRYLDLIMNQDRRELFIRKAKFWETNRKFLKDKGFIEVETPILEHFTGGADARPFVTHHNALDEDFYLRISTELYQKRLIGGMFEKIFTIGPNFRNEGIDDEHLQEYYQVEWYWAYADYRDNMKLVQEMFIHIAKEVYGKTEFEAHGHKFNLEDEWMEIDYASVIKEKKDVNIFEDSEEKMLAILKKDGVDTEGEWNRIRIIDNLWKLIRKDIAGPAFLVNEPKFMSPLAKSKPENEEITERFHVILAGSELGNGYTELNDPVDQYERFLSQQKARIAGDEEAQMMDIDYIEMLEYGMPPTSGYAHSERLFWFLEGLGAREATLFPQMKHRYDDNVKDLYPEFWKMVQKAKNE